MKKWNKFRIIFSTEKTVTQLSLKHSSAKDFNDFNNWESSMAEYLCLLWFINTKYIILPYFLSGHI